PACADGGASLGTLRRTGPCRVAAGGADEVRDLGVGHRRRAGAALPWLRCAGARQARVVACTLDLAVRRARRTLAAQVHRVDRLDRAGVAGPAAGVVDLAALSLAGTPCLA